MPRSEAYNIDCVEYMRTLPDKFFDLAIADPPYQLGGNSVSHSRHSGSGSLKNRVLNRSAVKFKEWDKAPSQEFFDELRRVSKDVIIWGGNYFQLPPTRCIVCWDKCQPWPNFSQVEVAWTSYSKPAKLFKYDTRRGSKIHPTQKPVELYAWCLNTFLAGGGKIFDPMMGSQSSRIAAYRLGYDYWGCEIDKEYFEAGCRRFAEEQQEQRIEFGK